MAGGFKLLHLVRPFASFLPEIKPSGTRKTPLREKIVYTVIVYFIFLICSSVPLYGIQPTTETDPWFRMRAILASNRGTLMELGISPITTAGLFMQILGGLFKVDNNVSEDRMLLNAAQKLLGILITVATAVTYILSGYYGSIGLIGVGNAILIIIQLTFAGIMVMYLDDLLLKGYGVGSAINLFTATNFCVNVVWKAFSPTTINMGRGIEFEGAIVALIHLLLTRKDKIEALHEAFYRENLPNVTNIIATVFFFLMFVYLQGFRVSIPVKSNKTRGQQGTYHIKLLYTGTMPIMIQSAFVSNLYFISHLLYRKFSRNFLVTMLGTWKASPHQEGYTPTGGIAYFVTPPSSLADMAANPLHALFYTTFMLSACAFFSKSWINVAGSSTRDVTRQLKDQNMEIVGHRASNMQKELNRYIPTAAAFGGMCIAALTIFADSTGAIGSATGIPIAVATIYYFLETYEKEKGLSI